MIVSDSTVSQALRLWNYLSAGNSCFPADAVLVCCSYDLRVCDHACRLMNEGYAEQLLFSERPRELDPGSLGETGSPDLPGKGPGQGHPFRKDPHRGEGRESRREHQILP